MEKFKNALAVAWDWISWAVTTIPVLFYDYVKGYPGQVTILWPVSVALAIWLL
jgi:hypothetical protein